VRRHLLVPGALAILAVAAVLVIGGAVGVPADAATVNGTGISRATLNADLAAINQNPAYRCYLAANIDVRSSGQASLPVVNGSGVAGTYNTGFVDFWLSQMINNTLVQNLAQSQHLTIDSGALAAGKADVVNTISAVLADAAQSVGQSEVCAPSAQLLLSSMPPALVTELVRAQASADLVLAHAAGYGITTDELARYFSAHPSQFTTLCISVIQTASSADASSVLQQIQGGLSFESAAQTHSTDSSSAANGGSLGCFVATSPQYAAVVQDTSGLSVSQVSQPISASGSYLLVKLDSTEPAAFDAISPAVRVAVLSAGSSKASAALKRATSTASVWVDPRYGRWSGGSTISVVPPSTPRTQDLLTTRT
jgi:hypothetical protein